MSAGYTSATARGGLFNQTGGVASLSDVNFLRDADGDFTVSGDLFVTGTANIPNLLVLNSLSVRGAIDLGSVVVPALTVTALTVTGGGTLAGTWTDLGTVTTVDINGGTIDGASIGSVVTSSGSFTTLSATGILTADLSIINSTGDLPVADGGTGASTALAARTNLDVDQAGTALALAIALG